MTEKAQNSTRRISCLRSLKETSRYSFSVSQASILVVLAVFLIVTFLVASMIGALWLPLFDMIWSPQVYEVERTIFFELRVPRVLMSGVVGASLALAGASLQGMFRNPLCRSRFARSSKWSRTRCYEFYCLRLGTSLYRSGLDLTHYP